LDELIRRIRRRKYAALSHKRATVSQATSELLSAKGFIAPGTADGTANVSERNLRRVLMTGSPREWKEPPSWRAI
jgi:hypothetical protein